MAQWAKASAKTSAVWNIWFHDGMTTGKAAIKEGKFGSISQLNLKECRNKQLCLVMYA
jgi:hypothetical protein